MALFLQREVRGAGAHHLQRANLELEGLFHAGGGHQLARGAHGAAQGHAKRGGEIFGQAVLQHELQVAKARAVVELDKAETLAVAHRAHPARHRYRVQALRGRSVVEFFHTHLRHGKMPPSNGRAMPG